MLDTRDLLYALDLMGTASFAFSGALRSLQRRPDIVGMIILATATAIGGGIIRDSVLLNRPATTLRDMNYLLVVLGSVLVTALFPGRLLRRERVFLYFDGVGLGVFSAIGAAIAWKEGMNPISVVFAACLTGAGGGVIRDVLLGQMPVVLYREVYVSAVAAGAVAMMIVRALGGGEQAGFLVAMSTTMVLRLLALYYNWSLPRIMGPPQPPSEPPSPAPPPA